MSLGGLSRWSRQAVLALCLTLGLVSPAQAVIDGKPDGNAHPDVGVIVTVDATGHGLICTGTLVAPATVLTAAHCVLDDPAFPPALAYAVSFRSDVQTPQDVIATGIAATPDPNPDYRHYPVNKYNLSRDVGLAHLSERAAKRYPGVTPAPIIGLNGLDALQKQSEPTVLQVGYGVQRYGPPGQEDSYFFDGTRRQSEFPIRKLTEDLAYGQSNPNDPLGFGSPCHGDSGSPWFFRSAVAVVHSFGLSGTCNGNSGGPRLDKGLGRAFLRSRGLVP